LLLDFLENLAEKTETDVTSLFVSPGKTKKTHTIARFLAKHADKEETFGKLEKQAVTAHIQRELSRIDEQARFSREALQLFSASVGADTARIRTELEKLSAFKPGGTFEASDVALLVGAVAEQAIFEALNALGHGDKKQAIRLFHREASGPEGAHPILAMCAWQMRRLLVVREAVDKGIERASDIAAQTKLPPFAVQSMLGAVRNLPMTRIKKGFLMLSDFDTKIKTGTMDPAVALDLFVWKF
ncbi:MAG: DNA polymerase III subunit delta, partial [Patescibacteria group bacterium]